MTRSEYVATLRTLGHAQAQVVPTPSGARFRGVCECGYESATRLRVEDVIEAIEHHRRKVVQAAKINAAVWGSLTHNRVSALPGTTASNRRRPSEGPDQGRRLKDRSR